MAELLKISSAFLPPPAEGFVSPMSWGVPTHITERFAQAGVPAGNISMVEDTFNFVSPDKNPGQVVDSFRRFFYGPHYERFRSSSEKRKRAGASRPACGTGEESEPERQRRHAHPRDLSARDSSRLRTAEST